MKRLLQRGYTLVEMLVTIAIITIMVSIFVGSYSFGKNFDTLKSETQRLSSVLRNVRVRDFNGIVQHTNICTGGGIPIPCVQDSDCSSQTCSASADLYPPGGYGIHIDTNYAVCSNNSNLSCSLDADCKTPGTCTGVSNRTNYILFADFSNPDGGSLYDGGKSGGEFITEYKLPASLTMERQRETDLTLPINEVDIIFKGSAVTVYDKDIGTWGTPITGSSHLLYLISVGGCTSQTRNQKGVVTITSATTIPGIADQLIPC
ncbi:MAG: prepilin-type N-terminal cleavage/methylation domain-containing protein [Candidatus Komeilibacteria bacterium]|nr:prepilin-type N-terminal cleavage/methylation domain-containing protein [Candidatus Komeilibacteria bacterium]